MRTWIHWAIRWIPCVFLLGLLPQAACAQPGKPDPLQELVFDRWAQRVARVSLTDTADRVREGYILYSRLDGFAWHDGYAPYQPGDTFTWISYDAWTTLTANRRGRFGQRIANSGILAAQLVGMGITMRLMGQRTRILPNLALAWGLGAFWGASSGGAIGFLTGGLMHENQHIYQNWQTDQRQLANLAAFPGPVRGDTIDGLLIPRRVTQGFAPRARGTIGVEWMQAGVLPWGQAGEGAVTPELLVPSEVGRLSQVPSRYRELSIFWRLRPGTHVGIRSGWPMASVRRNILSETSSSSVRAQIVGEYTLNRGRTWGVFAERQLLPWRSHPLQRWRMSVGAGAFVQDVSVETVYQVGFPTQRRIESSSLTGGQVDLRLVYRLTPHMRVYTLFRSQWTDTWTPSPVSVSNTRPDAIIRPGAVSQSGFGVGVGASVFLW